MRGTKASDKPGRDRDRRQPEANIQMAELTIDGTTRIVQQGIRIPN